MYNLQVQISFLPLRDNWKDEVILVTGAEVETVHSQNIPFCPILRVVMFEYS